MKIIRLAVLLLITLSSCKKTIDQQKEDYVLSVLTDGTWFLQNYTENDADNTYDFIQYDFKFYKDGKMDAISTNATVSGAWKGEPSKLTFTVTFPASEPTLSRLNHDWQWVKSNIGLIFAEIVTPTYKKTIRLKKR